MTYTEVTWTQLYIVDHEIAEALFFFFCTNTYNMIIREYANRLSIKLVHVRRVYPQTAATQPNIILSGEFILEGPKQEHQRNRAFRFNVLPFVNSLLSRK